MLVDGQVLEQVRLVGHEREAPLGLERVGSTRSWPSMRTRPEVGLRMPASDRSVVVLPAPFGPIRPTISPARDRERQVVDGGEGAGSGRVGAAEVLD